MSLVTGLFTLGKAYLRALISLRCWYLLKPQPMLSVNTNTAVLRWLGLLSHSTSILLSRNRNYRFGLDCGSQ